MRVLLTSLFMAGLVLGASVSVALAAESDDYPSTQQALPGPNVTFQHHASTVEEGVLRGGGAYLRGLGEAQYLRSLAAINAEHARRLYIENREQATEAYFNLKRLNRYAREELAAPRATTQDLARYAKERLPEVLSAQQYDRTNGMVIWPMALLREEFARDRSTIDALVLQRSDSNVTAPEIESEIAALTESMLATLRVSGADLNSTEFITAMKFLKSLNYDVRMSPTLAVAGVDRLAESPPVYPSSLRLD